MSDIILFITGCFVSLVVLAAVSLLLWGAANEPQGRLLPKKSRSAAGSRAGGRRLTRSDSADLGSKSVA